MRVLSLSGLGILLSLSVFSSPAGALEDKVPTEISSISEDWLQRIKTQIRRSEYEISYQKEGALSEIGPAFQAPNRVQNLRAYFLDEGFVVVPRTEQTPSWRWGLRWIVPSKKKRIPMVAGNRIEYRHGEMKERYVNNEKGLRQSFAIAEPDPWLVQEGELRIELEVSGGLQPKLDADGKAVDFLTDQGARVLRYGDLQARDARDKPLALRVELSENGRRLCLVVDALWAEFPVLVEPLTSTTSWTRKHERPDTGFGIAVAGAGDVNGDGYDDIIVGAYTYDNGQSEEGGAFVYHGSAEGLSKTPMWGAEGNQANAWFGLSVAGTGDVNADGYDDVIIGAPFFNGGDGGAFVFHGSEKGLLTVPSWSADNCTRGSWLGRSVAGAGDVNADGYCDVVVGAPLVDNGQREEGEVFVYYGSDSGLSKRPDWVVDSDQENAQLGYYVDGAGDVNGDGYDDIIAGAYKYSDGEEGEGRVFVYHGSDSGPSVAPDWTADGDQENAQLGFFVGGVGDVNADGFDDVIAGAPFYNDGKGDEGGVFVYLGGEAGLTGKPVWSAKSNQGTAFFGLSAAGAGDVNGDGFADVIVGAHSYEKGLTEAGRVYAYHGSSKGLAVSPDWIADDGRSYASFGVCVAGAGDVNGDGFADVVVGAYYHDAGLTDEGGGYVYHGSAASLADTPNWTAGSTPDTRGSKDIIAGF